jgi:hypothetical protein
MDTRTDNRESQMEKAEGSRENVNVDAPKTSESGGDANSPMERGAGQESQPEKPLPDPGGHEQGEHGGQGERGGQGSLPRGYPEHDRDNAGGITNRPLNEEEENQRALPKRGSAKGEAEE